MSISSHLTPEPERRLWIILEITRESAARSERLLMALTALCAAECFFLKAGPPALLPRAALVLLGLVLPLAVLGVAPLKRLPGVLSCLDPGPEKQEPGDCLITCHDLAHHTQLDLINRLDRYLGGGITATRYYEDIVGRILEGARAAVRKERILKLACLLAGAGQLALLALLAAR